MADGVYTCSHLDAAALLTVLFPYRFLTVPKPPIPANLLTCLFAANLFSGKLDFQAVFY